MTFDEAVALLGLTVPFTAKDVRRAYLRLLKVHKPETDPDGFMRLRQAYEMFEGVESVTRRGEPAPARELVAAPVAEASSEPADAVEPPEEVAAEPPVEPVDQAALPPWQRAVPEDPKDAATVLTEWLERAKSDPNAPPPPMGSALSLLWAMLDRRAFKTAGGLYRAMDEWLTHIGGARGQLAWGMTQGLWEMRKRIPEELYSAMVRAVATRDFAEVEARILAFEREQPGSALSMRHRLETEAPQLAAVFGKAFAVADRVTARNGPAPVKASSSGWPGAGFAIFLLLGLFRLLSHSTSSAPSKTVSFAPVAESVRAERGSSLASEVATLRSNAAALGAETVVADADAILQLANGADCQGAHAKISHAYRELQALEEQPQKRLRPMLSSVDMQLTLQCGGRKP